MKHYICYGFLIIAVLAAGVWIARQEIANARAEERSKASDEKQKMLSAHADEIEKTRKDGIAALEAEKAKRATVQTVTKLVTVPVPQGSTLEVRKADGMPCSPDEQCGQGQVVLTGDTQKNLDWIRNMEVDHQECDKNLLACQQNAIIAQQKLKTMTDDRDNWKNDAKGGSKGHRLVKGLKIDLGAGVGAAVGALADRKHPLRGAAIGAGTGAMAVQIFW